MWEPYTVLPSVAPEPTMPPTGELTPSRTLVTTLIVVASITCTTPDF